MPRDSERILTEYLILNAQSGKVLAMDQLLRLWYPKFMAYSARQLSDREAALDVVQDALIVMAKSLKRLRDPAAFPKWAYRILHRRGVDALRKSIRLRERETREIDVEAVGDATADNHNDVQQTVYAALRQLNDLSYNVIHLYYLHGLSVREIADVCDVPAGTVKSRLHSARNQLRQLLEDDL